MSIIQKSSGAPLCPFIPPFKRFGDFSGFSLCPEGTLLQKEVLTGGASDQCIAHLYEKRDLGITGMIFTNGQKFAVLVAIALIAKICIDTIQKLSDAFEEWNTFSKKRGKNNFSNPQKGLDVSFLSSDVILIVSHKRGSQLQKDLPKDWLVEEKTPSLLPPRKTQTMQNNLDPQKPVENLKPVVEHDKIPQAASDQKSASEEKMLRRLLLKKEIEEIENGNVRALSRRQKVLRILERMRRDIRNANNGQEPMHPLLQFIPETGKDRTDTMRLRLEGLKQMESSLAATITEIENNSQKLNDLRDELAKLEK